MTDWPMAAGNPQRTAYAGSESLGTTYSAAWRAPQNADFSPPELVHNQCGLIVSTGHVLIATRMGKLRSYATGGTKTLQWTADLGGAPIWSTPAADGTNVYVADTWGRMSAWRLSDGANVWGPLQITRHPGAAITSHVLLVDGLLFVGGHDRWFYAIDPATGRIVWSYYVGAKVMHGAAGDGGGSAGKVMFGAMDGTVICLNSQAGTLAWRTAAISHAGGFKDYWPVIHQSKVIVRPWMDLPSAGSGLTTPARGIPLVNYLTDNQDTALATYDASPSSYMPSLRVFALSNGAEQPAPIHWYWSITMGGSNPPPCVDKDNYLVIPAQRPSSLSSNYKHGWARLNLATRKIVDGLLEGTTEKGFGNQDENMCVSACSNGVLAMHIQEENAQYTGLYRQTDNTWYPAGVTAANGLYYTNTQGGGANPAAISGGRVYHMCHPSTLVAMTVT